MDSNQVLIQKSGDRWLKYSDPIEVLSADNITQVVSILDRIEASVNDGFHAAGFISYEAAPAFDGALKTHENPDFPLLWFGLYSDVEELNQLPTASAPFEVGDWKPSVSQSEYQLSVERIKAYISAGDTYQVNYTNRLDAAFDGDPYSLFYALCKSQKGRNCAYVDMGRVAICSASPELFFSLKGDALKSCPMKGTAPRGLSYDADMANEEMLRSSEKDRAENVMIVDMIRNDLGRIAEPGSVEVTSSFDVERYPTVLQMTSTVRARSSRSITEIMSAMFPCASITGAPKVRTMEIINELESKPRGVYTGTIGCIAPGSPRKALFNVAIRTVVANKDTGRAEYGVGGGIVWDSDGAGEYEECIQKARVLTERMPDFSLLETMLWTEGDGYWLLDEHLERLKRSALYFGIELDSDGLTSRLMQLSEGMSGDENRIRLLVGPGGDIDLESSQIPDDESSRVFKLGVSSVAVNSADRFLYHKTTNRGIYEEAKASCRDCDDVVLLNERGEVTETTIANIVAVINGKKITPAAGCGLLPGTMRARLLKNGEIEEGVISLEDLKSADDILLINSVRGWFKGGLKPES